MGVSPFEFPKIFTAEFAPEQALRTPLGAVSPLWLAYAGAASAGAAYWWMTRWMRPFHLEAFLAPAEAELIIAEAVVEAPQALVAEAAKVEAAVVEPVQGVAQKAVETIAETPLEIAPEPEQVAAAIKAPMIEAPVIEAPVIEAAQVVTDDIEAPVVEAAAQADALAPAPKPTPKSKAAKSPAARSPTTPAAISAPTTRPAVARRRPPRKVTPVTQG